MNHQRATGHAGGADYDVVIVGARCAGAATALLLARAGLSVLAVDKSGYGTDTLSTHALTRPAVLVLSRWGVLDDVRAAGTPRVSHVVHHYGDDMVDLPIRPIGDVDALYAPRRHVLDRILVDTAARHGAEIRHHATVRDLTFTADGRVSGVVVHDQGGVWTIRAGMVIGADGHAQAWPGGSAPAWSTPPRAAPRPSTPTSTACQRTPTVTTSGPASSPG